MEGAFSLLSMTLLTTEAVIITYLHVIILFLFLFLFFFGF